MPTQVLTLGSLAAALRSPSPWQLRLHQALGPSEHTLWTRSARSAVGPTKGYYRSPG